MPKQNFFVNEEELDDFQVQLLQKRINRSMVVSGCAGSGKSILALWKAKQIQELGGGRSYTFIVFTKALARYMSDGIREVGLNANNFVYHHKWRSRGMAPVDYVIVDEIQDFTRDEIAEFKAAARKAFFFWGDSAQSLYRGLKDTQNMLQVATDAGLEPEKLHFNHRLPRKIARFAANLGQDDDLVLRCRKEGEDLPRVLRYDTLEEQLDAAIEYIHNRDIDDAAILFDTNDMVGRAYEHLRVQGVSVEAKYDDKQDYTNSRFDLDFSSDNPKLMTYHSAKGLQFEAVFLPECSYSRPDPAPLYVAVTRSYRYLFVMYSDVLSNHFDCIPTDLYATTIEEDLVEF